MSAERVGDGAVEDRVWRDQRIAWGLAKVGVITALLLAMPLTNEPTRGSEPVASREAAWSIPSRRATLIPIAPAEGVRWSLGPLSPPHGVTWTASSQLAIETAADPIGGPTASSAGE